MPDERVVFVELVEDEVRICLMCCSEDHNLVKLGHVGQEPHAEWADFVDHATMLEVHECLIEVKHECVGAILQVTLFKLWTQQILPSHELLICGYLTD